MYQKVIPTPMYETRTHAYRRGYLAGYECVADIVFPIYNLDIGAFVRGFIAGTYDRVHENSGDYLKF